MKELFGRELPSEWMPQLREMRERFVSDRLSIDAAMAFALAAWSMVDRVASHTNDRGFIRHALNACPSLGYLRDLSNAYKHGEITKYKPVLKSSRFKRGAFGSGFSRDFDISRLELVVEAQGVVWFEDVVDASMAFWESYFSSVS
jgi:hypothetical protein